VENYPPTIENTFAKTIKAKGEEYDCDIIDTAGQVSVSYLFSSNFSCSDSLSASRDPS
jgi:Ras family protein